MTHTPYHTPSGPASSRLCVSSTSTSCSCTRTVGVSRVGRWTGRNSLRGSFTMNPASTSAWSCSITRVRVQTHPAALGRVLGVDGAADRRPRRLAQDGMDSETIVERRHRPQVVGAGGHGELAGHRVVPVLDDPLDVLLDLEVAADQVRERARVPLEVHRGPARSALEVHGKLHQHAVVPRSRTRGRPARSTPRIFSKRIAAVQSPALIRPRNVSLWISPVLFTTFSPSSCTETRSR